jgi:hypothetical protein
MANQIPLLLSWKVFIWFGNLVQGHVVTRARDDFEEAPCNS